MKIKGRLIYPGIVSGTALVSSMKISFFGGVDPETGIILEKDHDLEGVSIRDNILVFPSGKGSTVGSYTLYRLKLSNNAPRAIINSVCETIIAVGCIIAEIPCIDQIPIDKIKSGNILQLDADHGIVNILSAA